MDLARTACAALGLLLATPAAAQTGSPAGTSPAAITADEKGLVARSADGAFAFRLKGVVQADARFYLDDAQLDDRDAFLVRRARPILDGTVLGIVDFRLVPDFAEGRAQIFDAYIDLRPWSWLRLRVGKFKPPLGLERLQSDPELPFMERAQTANLSPTRDLGVQLGGELAGGFVSYALGVFDGAPDNGNIDGDTNHAKDFAGRLFVHPLALLGSGFRGGVLGLGLAASTGNQLGTSSAPGLPGFRTGGQNVFFSYLAVANDPNATVIAWKRRSRLNPEFYYFVGPVGLLAEFIATRQKVLRADSIGELTHTAWHATASFALGGKVSYDGVVARNRFDAAAGHWGAGELALRVSGLSVDEDAFPLYADPTKSARRALGLAAALNWYLGRNARLGVNFERTSFEGGASAGDRPAENALMSRLQVAF
jgi:phosphate-selective porin OprO/OprP